MNGTPVCNLCGHRTTNVINTRTDVVSTIHACPHCDVPHRGDECKSCGKVLAKRFPITEY